MRNCRAWSASRWGISLKPLKFHPEAFAEIQAAPIYHYENDLLEIGDALVSELDGALDEIEAHPGRWKRILDSIHSYGPTKKFKWRIVYIELAQEIFVIAAYYSGEEDPLYWIERLAS